MKVLAVKGVEKYSNLWVVRYTRLTRRGVKQGAVFLCDTPEEASEKHEELLDLLKHHDGVYDSKSKYKRRSKYKKRTGDISAHLREYHKQYYIKKLLGEL